MLTFLIAVLVLATLYVIVTMITDESETPAPPTAPSRPVNWERAFPSFGPRPWLPDRWAHILDTLQKQHAEELRVAYLSLPAPGEQDNAIVTKAIEDLRDHHLAEIMELCQARRDDEATLAEAA